MSSQPIHVTCGNHRGPKSKRGLEQYKTPLVCMAPLVASEPLPPRCWDICGKDDDAIAVGLRAYGIKVVTNDIAVDGVDFRKRRKTPRGVEAIVTNPPFSLAADFVQHGLTLVKKVIVLERIQWLETDIRTDFFNARKLARIFIFRNRVPRMHREDWKGKRASPSMMLAWYVFDRDHNGALPVLDWIRWEKV